MVGGVIGTLVVFAVIAFILPVISIYFWIVVNSLRKKIIESRRFVMPIQAQPPSFVGKFKRGLSLLDSRFSEGLKLTF